MKAESALRLTFLYLYVEVQIKYWFCRLNIKHFEYFGAGFQLTQHHVQSLRLST